MLIKKMLTTIYIDKKFASALKNLLKKFPLQFSIAESSNYQDLHTTYSEISAN